jgi:class 3 adenylate cyclase/predicted ATPase
MSASVCGACGTELAAGAKFCSECGTAQALACPECSTPHAAGAKFCAECGTSLVPDRHEEAVAVRAAAPTAERRLVSVLFADLVGFTTLSESRDPEEVRELLSRYFDTCRRLIELYGGSVEKFIGDAVMAAWGTPTATEDDAERAVRAALDLVTAVSALGDEVGAELRARAGVLTGEAAVTLGAEGQGMVAGDLVNTAARIQSAADPGAVLVGDATRRASEATVAYAPAGEHDLKGKAEAVQLWRALRVTSGRQGSQRSAGLEAPFVGRERELRKIKDLFHACAEERRAYLVSVTGIAGIGKSRLAWEFEKYVDGVALDAYWHRGRCLSYGEGVTYWALADMVRMRCRIAEDEPAASARAKLQVTLEEHLLDADERRFVEPRLAQLLGLAEEVSGDKHDLFAAWRLFFERLADVYPTVLVFEDLQWADASLLDFVEYLLEWARSSPLFVLTLARPELHERRAAWGAGHRNFTSVYLEPLPVEAMEELLAGLVPGLPDELRAQILARAQGVPLYAVETVRMLLDRGLLVQDGLVYRPTGEVETLDVPETLHALIAARLDGLPPPERRLLQDAAVLGKTFTSAALTAVSGIPDAELEPVLASLVRKEVLSLQSDPRSPEHGQYGFLQDIIRHVAYETLSRHERRTRHLAAAAYLEGAFADEGEIAEVLSSHYLDAHAAVPDADDADDVKERARGCLIRAGARADALGAAGEAQRYVTHAAELTEGHERAELLERAGRHAWYAADYEAGERLLSEAAAGFEALGDTRGWARASRQLARVEWDQRRHGDAVARYERALEVVSAAGDDREFADLASSLALALCFTDNHERAAELSARALDVAESLGLSEATTRVFIVRGMIASAKGHPQEAHAYMRQALAIALDNETWEAAYNTYFNLSDWSFQRDRYEDALENLRAALEIARRRGSRPAEWGVLAETTYPLYMLGRWEEALATASQVPEEKLSSATTMSLLTSVLEIDVHRGDVAEAGRVLSLFAHLAETSDVQDRTGYGSAHAAVLRDQGRLAEAVTAGVEAAEMSTASFGIGSQSTKQGLVEAIEAALALEERERAEQLIETIDDTPAGLRPPYLAAHAARFRARLAGSDESAESGFEAAAEGFRRIGVVFWLAVTLLEHGEWLAARGRPDEAEPLLAEAREVFDRLEAKPWLDRLEAVHVEVPTEIPT